MVVKGREAAVVVTIVGLLARGGIWWNNADSREVNLPPGASVRRRRTKEVKRTRAKKRSLGSRETASLN